MPINHQTAADQFKANPPPNDMNEYQAWKNANSPAIAMDKPSASAALTKLSPAEHDAVLSWLHSHTALNRLSHVELVSAFARLEREAGFGLVKVSADE